MMHRGYHPYARGIPSPIPTSLYTDYPPPPTQFLDETPIIPPGRQDQSLIEARRQKERMSRTLFVRNISYDVPESTIREMFEKYGEIKKLFLLVEKRGMAFITYYDIRNAEKAKKDLQSKELNGRPIDVHYSLPKDDADPEELHNGTLYVTFRSNPGPPPNAEIQKFFEKWGEVKEVRDCRNSPSQKFIEYYDTRNCETALKEANGLELGGTAMDVRMAYNSKRLGEQRPEEYLPPPPPLPPARAYDRALSERDYLYDRRASRDLDIRDIRDIRDERDWDYRDRWERERRDALDRYRDDRRGVGPVRGYEPMSSAPPRSAGLSPPLSLSGMSPYDDYGYSPRTVSSSSPSSYSTPDLQQSMLSHMTQLAHLLAARQNSVPNSNNWSNPSVGGGSGGTPGMSSASSTSGGSMNPLTLLQHLQNQIQSGAPAPALQQQLNQLQQLLQQQQPQPQSRGHSGIDSRSSALDRNSGIDNRGGGGMDISPTRSSMVDSRSSLVDSRSSRASQSQYIPQPSSLPSQYQPYQSRYN